MDSDKKLLHIAIIPDGNRRWAKEKGLATLEGHRKGAENFERLLTTSRDLGIKYFSSWAFSTENWKRTEEENTYLFALAREFIEIYKEKFLKENTRFIHLGRKDRLPADVVKSLVDLETKTKELTDLTVMLGMDYGGHEEILASVKKVIAQGLELTEKNIAANLYTHNAPPPDLIIRTGGDQRLSGFMLWQSAYSEFYFAKKYYPDFGPEELKTAVADFYARDRRYGGDSKN